MRSVPQVDDNNAPEIKELLQLETFCGTTMNCEDNYFHTQCMKV